ncbi:MAG TPA: nitrite/sulfite reductase, partial [Candidatus Lustribacter sp.]|nr:nitrite/sulfite reductase [Candidatus Lustribacter sp.]
MLAQRLGVWVGLDEVPEVWAGVISIFRDYGYRRLRTRARLKFLVADWGAERFRAVLEGEYLGRRLADGPPPEQPEGRRRDHVGVHAQRDGRLWVGVAPVAGRVSGSTLAALADLAQTHGSGRVRLTPHQKILVLDVEPGRVEALVARLDALGLPSAPSEFRRGVMACTGIEYCKLALVETKARAAQTVTALEAALPGFDASLSIHVNGCPNSCARFQVADIGLKGMIMADPADPAGPSVEGFQVHLGGSLGEDAALARKTRSLRVTAEELPTYVERVATRYTEQREDGESFARWARRADEEALR